MKCIKCGAPVSEEEFRKRYEELLAQGIVAMMVPMCKECRHWSNWKSDANHQVRQAHS